MQGQAKIKVFKFEKMTVRVYIPDLTDDERKYRMSKIHTAAIELLKSKKE